MKILFVGMGSIGTRHYQCLKKITQKSNQEFLSFRTSPETEKREVFEDIRYFWDFEDALAQHPDCAIISNPTSLHVKYALKCAKEGIHLFIEKPLSDKTDMVDELIDEIESKNLITLMGCNLRYHPVLKKLKEIVEKKQFGKVLDFDINVGSNLPDWRPWQDYRQSYSAKKSLGGGVILDLIHEIDYAYWLFGGFREVCAFTGKISDLDIETEDIAKILVKTNHDIFGSISMNYYQKTPRRSIWVNFENGSAEADLVDNTCKILSASGMECRKFDFTRNTMYEEQMAYFLRSVIDKKQTTNDIHQGLTVLQYALQIKRGGKI